jgi:hypothetical protein
MTDRVHAGVHGVQPACLHAPGDRRSAEPKVEQLPTRNDAVLAPCELREP